MDPTALLIEYSPWLFIAYVLLKDVLPKLFPAVAKAISKRITTEDRLFTLLETNAEVLLKLNFSFVELSETLKQMDHRLEAVEDLMKDNTSALKIASRLIKD